MLVINNKNKDPYLNHAIEEHLMNKLDDDCFMLWQNSPCVLLGRNQNAYLEVNMDYARAHNIKIVRRITGGGTVFNDNGNFNFTFISSSNNHSFADFTRFTQPIINALRKQGVPAEFHGRNDLVIDGKKFSGNAQCKVKDKILHHGTLLFGSDIEALGEALNVNYLKLQSKSIASAKNRVTNIKDHLSKPMTLEEFRIMLLEEVRNSVEGAEYYELTEDDLLESELIATKRYRQDSWNYQEKLDFEFLRECRFTGGLVQVNMNIAKGIIKDIRINGDFFNEKDISEVEGALVGLSYDYQTIFNALNIVDIDKYFKNISREDLMSVII